MIRYLFITSCLLVSLFVKGQAPVADFSVNFTEGCAPLQVVFKDLSSGTPKFWNWDFGNGQLSNQQNPTTVFYNPGKYTVKLVVRNADGTNGITKTDYITIFPSPVAAFTSDKTTTCLPANINFVDQTSVGAGTISKYEWDFGDGTTSSAKDPVKAYTANGFYNVNLKVTSSTGCTGSKFVARYIRIVSGVTANFRDTVSGVCRPPFVADFTNESSGPGTMSYEWNFGNGNTSTITNPTNPYSATGTFNVNLIAKSDLGCADTTQKTVTITGSNTGFTSPANTCLNQPVNFQNTSAPAPTSSVWDFGDGTTSSAANPSKTYTVAGTYKVRLLATYPLCKDSLVKDIVVNAAAPIDFSSNSAGACKGPVSVNFTDLSPDVATRKWDFGDGGTSTAASPSHTYTTNGSYTVTLTITNTAGCTNTLTKTGFVTVAPPTPTISNAPAGGCIPFTFSPVARVNTVDPIASYLWDFGDAGATSTSPTPSHTYATAGNYTLKLTVTTAGGCTNSITIPNGVRTGTSSTPAFTSNKIQACTDSAINFTNQSTPGGLTYLWNFGDNQTSPDVNPVHQYGAPGTYRVTLISSNNGCEKSTDGLYMVTVLPPLARFYYRIDCRTRPTVTFQNTSTLDPAQPATYFWQFGDPANSTSTQENPVFQYPAVGKYTVSFTVTQGGCSNTIKFEISAMPEVAKFIITPKDTTCRNQVVTFLSQSSNPQNISSYQWSVAGGAYFPFGKDLSTQINRNGTFPISLVITDASGCSDTATLNLTQLGPFAAFTPSDTAGCVNTTVTFTDQSNPVTDITSWQFDYGDGTVQTYTKGPFTHQYQKAGTFNVTLKVTAKTGCTDSLTKPALIRISKPMAAFGADNSYFCPGGLLQFTDSSQVFGTTKYLWNFGDKTTSTIKNPQHSYSGRDSSYTVSLKITDSLGCSDSISKAGFITTKSPKAAFDVKDSVGICPPLETKFTLRAQNYESYYWDFGDSTFSTLANPNHFYNVYGKYKPKLVVVGKGGCLDSIEHSVSVYNPANSVVNYSPISACNSLLVDFTVVGPPSVISAFNFGDGTQDTTGKTTFQHLYNSPNFYLPYLYLKDSLLCEVFVPGQNYISIIGAEPLFSIDKKLFCDSGTIFLTNYTIGNDPVKSYLWNYGNGVTSNDKEPIYSFKTPGQYLVSLTVNTEAGCSKTATDTVRIYPTPVPIITSPDAVCINSPITFKGSLATPDSTVSWIWTYGNGGIAYVQNPSVTYTAAGPYTVNVQAANTAGCKSVGTKQVVALPLPVITRQSEPSLAVGGSVILPVTYSAGVTSYNWTPVRDLSCSDCPNPSANPKLTTKYTVNVADSNGCASSKDITVNVVCNSNNYFVPNTFTPNGDGVNDVFYPRGSGVARVQSMRIFNRWGQIIYEKRNFSANSAVDGWNGTYKGKIADPDAYVYFIEFICDNGLIIPFKGNVTLIR